MKDITSIKRLWKQWKKAMTNRDVNRSKIYSNALKEHGIETLADYKKVINNLDTQHII